MIAGKSWHSILNLLRPCTQRRSDYVSAKICLAGRSRPLKWGPCPCITCSAFPSLNETRSSKLSLHLNFNSHRYGSCQLLLSAHLLLHLSLKTVAAYFSIIIHCIDILSVTWTGKITTLQKSRSFFLVLLFIMRYHDRGYYDHGSRFQTSKENAST